MRKEMKYLIMFLLLTILTLGKSVSAKEIYYTNNKGVSFTKEQYDFYTYLTYDGFQKYVTQEMLDEIDGKDLSTLKVEKVGICPTEGLLESYQVQDNGAFYKTSAKALSMGKYCTADFCRIMSQLEWLGDPTNKSHDVMGAYLYGPTRRTDPVTIIGTDDNEYEEDAMKFEGESFGAVFQLPREQNIIVDQTFLYNGSGTIYVSYQHAMKEISLQDSLLFHLDTKGYGAVFDFYGAAADRVYDEMQGVYLEV